MANQDTIQLLAQVPQITLGYMVNDAGHLVIGIQVNYPIENHMIELFSHNQNTSQ